MGKKLLALLLAASLASCITFPNQKMPAEKLILFSFYDEGVIFLKDTNGDNKLDTKLYYEIIGKTKQEAEFLNPDNYLILKYKKSEPLDPI